MTSLIPTPQQLRASDHQFSNAMRDLLSASQWHHSTPRTAASLSSLIESAREACRALDELGSREWQAAAQDEVAYLEALRVYLLAEGKERVHRALHQRFTESLEGAIMVGLEPSYAYELLDPRHRGSEVLRKQFQHWLALQRAHRCDPAENILDFLLGMEEGGTYRAMDDETLAEHQLTFGDNGLVYRARTMEAYDSKGGEALRTHDFVMGDAYVVAPDGRWFSTGGRTFHSQFLGGEGVLSAGIIVVKGGKVQAIDNRSGHYRPGWKNLHQAVELLAEQEAFAPDAIVGLVASEQSTMYFTVGDFIWLGRRGFCYEDTAKVVSGYQRRYHGHLPVAPAKLEWIPESQRKGWHNGGDNCRDRFLNCFYPFALHRPAGPALRPVFDWLPAQCVAA